MSNVINFYLAPLIKVKAKIYKVSEDGSVETDKRKFNLNAQNTSYDSLRLLLAQLFDITGEFTISYKNKNNDFAHLESEEDLKTALNSAYYCSNLYFIVKAQPLDGILDDWDIISPSELPPLDCLETRNCKSRGSFMGSILDQVGKTMVKVTRAFSIDNGQETDFEKSPMTLSELTNFMDDEGRLVKSHEFHLAVFRGGVEPCLRPVVWLHLLNVFPDWMTSYQRKQYLKTKAKEYFKLRYSWQRIMNEGEASDILKNITTLVRKDVRRTDRTHKFYSGPDDNRNVQTLFNILTTYAVTHPNVHYCQGMSDLLSPILYVMRDEAEAYIAFCGQMQRLESNFRTDGRSIRMKFRHLRKMLFYYDRELFLYLKAEGAASLLFCYRWLVLELKREFEYDETLHMFEIMWGSMPPKPPAQGIELSHQICTETHSSANSINIQMANHNLVWNNDHYSDSSLQQTNESFKCIKSKHREKDFESRARHNQRKDDSSANAEINLPIHYRKRRYRSYTNRKLNRLSMSNELSKSTSKNAGSFNICQSWAYGDDFENHSFKINTAVVTAREFLRSQWCYSNTVNEIQLNNWLNGKWWESTGTPEKFNDFQSVVNTLRQRHGSSDSNYSTNTGNSECLLSDSECRHHLSSVKSQQPHKKNLDCGSDAAFSSKEFSAEEGYNSDVEEESTRGPIREERKEAEEDYEDDDDDDDYMYSCRLMDSMVGKKYEEAISYFHRKKDLLPPPHSLGDGNPFLLFLCLTMLMQQKEKIMKKKMDVNELCIHFDKLVRKHKLGKVINSARYLFGEYLNMGWNEDLSDSDDEFMP